MKTLLKSLKITLAFCVFFSVFYILILWLFAQVAGPNKGNAEVVTLNGKVVGAANVGQMFTKDIYFWGRPSCAGDGYDATSSAGSNKGPTNQEYLDEVKARIVAQACGLREEQVKSIVDESIEKPLLGFLGTEKVNVLKLNIALEEKSGK